MALLLGLAGVAGWPLPAFPDEPVVKKDVPFVPTPQDVVEEMVRLADLGPDDLLYDLGSGDGRIVITAAKEYGAHAVGVDIDPQRIRESNENARKAGVTDRVKFVLGNLFETDLRPATAVTMYLLPRVNLELRPKLLSELEPGTPVVSHAFDMGDWQPDKTHHVGGRTVYLWIVPAQVDGRWHCTIQGAPSPHGCTLAFDQQFQKVSGKASLDGHPVDIEDGHLTGDRLSFSVTQGRGGKRVTSRFDGHVQGGSIKGTVVSEGEGGAATQPVAWSAERQGTRVSRLTQ